MDYEKLHNETLSNLQEMVSKGKITEEVAKGICADFVAESEDEKIRKEIMEFPNYYHTGNGRALSYNEDWIVWLEKQGEKKPCMIQWKGDNLKEVLDFTGKDKNFDKWFNSFEEYKEYVSEHDNIFKIFNPDGSHLEVPVGAWIVKTPDDFNVASKSIFKQKPVEWSEEDKRMLRDIIAYAEAGIKFGDTPQLDWLKSLKDRVQLQSMQEWSEEDIVAIDCAVEVLSKDLPSLAASIERLKSLRPQKQYAITEEELSIAKKDAYNEALDKIEYSSGEPTFDDGWSAAISFLRRMNAISQKQWKPSEEQMQTIDFVINYHAFAEPKRREELKELLEQLKAL